MQPLRRLHKYTYRDYVAIEEISPATKHEFLDGEIYAMAGGTVDHSALGTEVLRVIGNALGEGPCQVHGPDLRVYVLEAGLATFPDGSVICGEVEQHAPSPRDTALNPTLLVEVTSDSSEDYDVGTKLECYRMIPSLRECVVVSHRERRITVHRRGDGATWTSHVAITGGRIGLVTAPCELVVDAIYRRTAIT